MATVNEIKKTFEPLFKVGLTPFLMGTHGVGKSASVKQYTKDKEIGFVDLRLSNMDIGDLIGLPYSEKCPATGETIMKFARPDWFPIEGEGVLFLDELNLAPKHILNACFQLILDREIVGRKLPKGWNIVVAGNPPTGDYSVTDIVSKALMDRFCLMAAETSPAEFINYAKGKGLNKSVIQFIAQQPDLLTGKLEDFSVDSMVAPSSRTWEFAAKLEDIEDLDEQTKRLILRGMLGFTATTAYMDFLEKNQLDIKPEDVLKDFGKVKSKFDKLMDPDNFRLDHINQLNDKLSDMANVRTFKKKELENFLAYLNYIPKDVAMKFLMLASEPDNSSIRENIKLLDGVDKERTIISLIRDAKNTK